MQRLQGLRRYVNMKNVRGDSHQSKEDDTWSQGMLSGYISIQRISFEGFPLSTDSFKYIEVGHLTSNNRVQLQLLKARG